MGTKDMIPDEILFRAEALGHLPEEYAEPYVRLIKEAAEGEEKSLIQTLDEVVRSVPGFSVFFVIRPFIEGNDARIKNAFFRSKELMLWLGKNKERVMRMRYGT